MIISVPYFATIGDDVLIEEAGNADTDFHSLDISRKTPDETLEKCRIVIGNRVFIGSSSLINKGFKIGDYAVVCPVSIVTTSLPGGSMVSGNPTRIARSAKEHKAKP